MANTWQFKIGRVTSKAKVSAVANSFLFADSIIPIYAQTEGTADNAEALAIVTSNVTIDEGPLSLTDYEILADDSDSEVSVDISTGKFVEGNLICGYALYTEVQNDVRNFVTYKINGSDFVWFKGICSTTQSQDYTPLMLTNNRAIHMLTPEQVASVQL